MERYKTHHEVVEIANEFFGVDVRNNPKVGEISWEAKCMTAYYLSNSLNHRSVGQICEAVNSTVNEVSLFEFNGKGIINLPKNKIKYLALKRLIEE